MLEHAISAHHDRRLRREIAVILVIKLIALWALWWGFIRDYRVAADIEQVEQNLVGNFSQGGHTR